VSHVVVAGGGVIGTAVSVGALDRGHTVTHLERDAAPRGASVRNFGLVWICGRAGGRELELALQGRSLWRTLGERAPAIGFRQPGCLLVARSQAELDLIAAACDRDDSRERGFRLVAPDEARRLNPLLGEIAGALHSPLDSIVEPAAALTALRELCEATGRYRFIAERTVVDLDGGAIDHTGARHAGDVAVICPGEALEWIPAAIREPAGLSRRSLQMLELAPLRPQSPTVVADGDAMRYYPAFDLPERAAIPPPDPIVERYGAQLLAAPRLDGALTVGDTHVDDQPGMFGSSEEADEHLLGRVEELLGPRGAVRRRWTGSYVRRTDGADCIVIATIKEGVVVTAAGGMGMTAAPAFAREALSHAGL
jgi:FAD dependent oxidoreductase TIGR03364